MVPVYQRAHGYGEPVVMEKGKGLLPPGNLRQRVDTSNVNTEIWLVDFFVMGKWLLTITSFGVS